MHTYNHRHRRRAVLALEVIYAIGVLGLITVMTIDAIAAYYKTRDQYAWRQAAVWAAAAQIQRYQAGAPFDSKPPESVLPESVQLKTSATPGSGDWAGFDRVTVTATVELPFKHAVKEQITGYVRKGRGS